MANLVFVLCAVTSFACAVLLLRGWRQQRARLLLWSGLCFVGFAIGNAMLTLEAVVGFSHDLTLARNIPIAGGLMVLIYGLVWEA